MHVHSLIACNKKNSINAFDMPPSQPHQFNLMTMLPINVESLHFVIPFLFDVNFIKKKKGRRCIRVMIGNEFNGTIYSFFINKKEMNEDQENEWKIVGVPELFHPILNSWTSSFSRFACRIRVWYFRFLFIHAKRKKKPGEQWQEICYQSSSQCWCHFHANKRGKKKLRRTIILNMSRIIREKKTLFWIYYCFECTFHIQKSIIDFNGMENKHKIHSRCEKWNRNEDRNNCEK